MFDDPAFPRRFVVRRGSIEGSWMVWDRQARRPAKIDTWVHEFACEGPQARELSGIIGRDDEPKMMPVVLATVREGSAIRLV